MQTKSIVITALILIIIASLGINAYLYFESKKLQHHQAKLEETINKNANQCPKGMVCKDFKWVEPYIEVVSGELIWIDCGEGENKCARWEDYSGQNALPRVRIFQCNQQGTRFEDNEWVTGLPEGEHTLVGITLRPCEDIIDATGENDQETSE